LSRPNAGSRPYLVVLRANEQSVHPDWIRDIEDDQRNWDFCVSYYGDESTFGQDTLAEYQVHQPHERKFAAIHHLFWRDSPLWRYDYVFLAEDDLMMSWRDLNRMFATCRRYGLDLAQPTLTGNVNQSITRPDPEYLLRYVSFVELIAPIFSNAALRLCLPSFQGVKTGYGLDHIWPKLLGEPRDRIAMLDDIVVTHTRPGNSPTSSYNYEAALDEGWRLQQRYSAGWRTVEFGGVRRGERDRHGDWAEAARFEPPPPPPLSPC
jgi:hypothetical protein